MAFSLNKIMLIGNLGKDAETRFTTNNVAISSFSLATTRGYKNQSGNWENETTWHNVVAFNLSDFYRDSLKKGKKFYIEGRLSKRDYVDKDNIKRYMTEVIAEKLIPLEARDGGESHTSEESSEEAPPPNLDSNDDLPF